MRLLDFRMIRRMPPREPIVALFRTQGLAVGEHGAIVADDPKLKLDVQAICNDLQSSAARPDFIGRNRLLMPNPSKR
jgi:hypothetical protein